MKINILGKKIGEIYVKECLGGHPLKYSCKCPCGNTFSATSQSIRTEKIDCGCGIISGYRRRLLKPGDIYNGCEIVCLTKKNNQNAYIFKCYKCGKECEKTHAEFFKNPICPKCLKEKNKAEKIEKANKEFAGKEINGIKILRVFGREKSGDILVIAVCPICKNEFETRLERIKSGLKYCKKCNLENLNYGHMMIDDASVEGTNVLCIHPEREINKNNTTGHKGVSRSRGGRYRAYIFFKRKQYHLGNYSRLEDAVAAREMAEKEIYGNFLEWYKTTYPERWDKIKNAINKST